MKLSGFADEASVDINKQIKVIKELGWEYISLRTIGDKNIHDISDKEFDEVYGLIDQNGLKVAEFGTLIGSWSKTIHSDWTVTKDEIDRCIPRMLKLNVKMARVMSYGQESWGDDQKVSERVVRLRHIVERFEDAGLIAVHENCMNYGGLSADHTLRLIEEIPNLKLVFDTGNPVSQIDRSKTEPAPWQDVFAFYNAVKDHVIHYHIKDVQRNISKTQYVYPGEGLGYIKEILRDLIKRNYQGILAIEPHMGKVFHENFKSVDEDRECQIFIEYGHKLEHLIKSLG